MSICSRSKSGEFAQQGELVWERIWKTKERWTEEELVDSYRYYLKSCDKERITPKLTKELEELLEKPYYRNVRYKR